MTTKDNRKENRRLFKRTENERRVVVGVKNGQNVYERSGEFVTVPTFVHFDGNLYPGSGTYSECKVKGSIIRVDKGFWDDLHQDWRANIVFNTGVTVESALWYKNFIAKGIPGEEDSPMGAYCADQTDKKKTFTDKKKTLISIMYLEWRERYLRARRHNSFIDVPPKEMPLWVIDFYRYARTQFEETRKPEQ